MSCKEAARERSTQLAEVGVLELPFRQGRRQRRDRDGHSVADVAQRRSEEEWERGDGEDARVQLLVRPGPIAVRDGLEALGKLVRAIEGRRRLVSTQLMEDWWNVRSGLFL